MKQQLRFYEAIVCFTGKGVHPLNFLLHKDFRHCFVCVKTGRYWVQIDQVAGVVQIDVVAGKDYDLCTFFEEEGYTVVKTQVEKSKGWTFNVFQGNIMVSNCVGIVKSVLNIKSAALTPYQLYKRLNK